MTINDIRNDLIKKVKNLTIKDAGKNLINKVKNLTIKNVGNDSNGATASAVKVHFGGNSAVISHQNVLSGRMTGIRHEELPVLVLPTERSIIEKYQPDVTNCTGVIQTPHALKIPAMQEFIAVTNP